MLLYTVLYPEEHRPICVTQQRGTLHSTLWISQGEMEMNMHIILNNSSMIPIYEQLMDQIKAQILSGDLKDNEALPSVRSLSGELKISALTVKKAYDKLEEEGFVTTMHGKGTFVSAVDQSLALEARINAVEDECAKAVDRARSVNMTKEEIYGVMEILLEDFE